MLAPRVRTVLDRGVFCHVAVETSSGPHLTPTVFAIAGDRIWVTTSRGTVKARTWRRDDRVTGLVRAGDDAVAFGGCAIRHDALDPSTWMRSLLEGPLVALATARFAARNARFFAGYAVDANRVPLAWTPPGRVFVELELERTALLRSGRVVETWGEWPDALPSRSRFSRPRSDGALDGLPDDLRAALGDGGDGALAVRGGSGGAVIPATWRVERGVLYAVVSREALALAGPTTASPRVALTLDRPSSWRARHMLGAMVRGTSEIAVIDRLTSGAQAARALAYGDGDVVVTVRPERSVWWRGWESGTVDAA
jgi:pyridoxamine 5'-phosphate oxidase-like protein